jgi:hypothetical protein
MNLKEVLVGKLNDVCIRYFPSSDLLPSMTWLDFAGNA